MAFTHLRKVLTVRGFKVSCISFVYSKTMFDVKRDCNSLRVFGDSNSGNLFAFLRLSLYVPTWFKKA